MLVVVILHPGPRMLGSRLGPDLAISLMPLLNQEMSVGSLIFIKCSENAQYYL